MPEPERQKKNAWAYLNIGAQFGAIVLSLSFAGVWLDDRFAWTPWATVVGSLLGVALATYQLIRNIP
jgi:F0F1-type ATP synthase assembly protein I